MATTKKKRSTMPVSKATNAFELLGEIIEIILEEPLRYDQIDTLSLERYGDYEPRRGYPACGTVGCVAGWTVALKGVPSRGVWGQASSILGLRERQDDELFDAGAAGRETQTKAHARAGAAHIKKFMKAHEAQLKAKAV